MILKTLEQLKTNLKVLAIRNRTKGSEISVQEIDTGKEYVFWRNDYLGKSKANCLTWATPIVGKAKEEEANTLALKASVDTEVKTLSKSFIDWVKANKDVPEVKGLLKELSNIKQWQQ